MGIAGSGNGSSSSSSGGSSPAFNGKKYLALYFPRRSARAQANFITKTEGHSARARGLLGSCNKQDNGIDRRSLSLVLSCTFRSLPGHVTLRMHASMCVGASVCILAHSACDVTLTRAIYVLMRFYFPVAAGLTFAQFASISRAEQTAGRETRICITRTSPPPPRVLGIPRILTASRSARAAARIFFLSSCSAAAAISCFYG